MTPKDLTDNRNSATQTDIINVKKGLKEIKIQSSDKLIQLGYLNISSI